MRDREDVRDRRREDSPEACLKAVYGATSLAEVSEQYDRWAPGYDDDVEAMGRPAPAIILALLARHLPVGSGPILDVGAGTGIMGQYMRLVGYADLEALDISKGMLKVAKDKGVYRRHHRAALGEPLGLPDDCYAGIVGVGIFTVGHAAPESFDELLRVTKPGGNMIFTVTRSAYEKGYGAKQYELERDKRWELAKVTPPFTLHPKRRGSPEAQGYVYRVL